MTNHVIDYSAGVPSAAIVKALGYVGAVRYLKKSGPSSVHTLTANEYRDYVNHGLTVALIYEAPQANRMLSGYDAGLVDGRWADNQTADLNIFPRCIYAACDFDVQPSQYNICREYLLGFVHGTGTYIGLYGGYNAIQNLRPIEGLTYYWQTSAWSGGKIHPLADIYQYGKDTIQSIQCDVSRIVTPDWGQQPYSIPVGDSMSTQDVSKIFDELNTSAVNTANGTPDRLTPYIDGLCDRLIQKLEAKYPNIFHK